MSPASPFVKKMLLLLSVPLGDDSDSELSVGHILVEQNNCWLLMAASNQTHDSKTHLWLC